MVSYSIENANMHVTHEIVYVFVWWMNMQCLWVQVWVLVDILAISKCSCSADIDDNALWLNAQESTPKRERIKSVFRMLQVQYNGIDTNSISYLSTFLAHTQYRHI